MPLITSFERVGIERGRVEGRREGLLIGLEPLLAAKFGEADRRAFEDMRQIEDVAVLEAITRRLPTATSLEEVRPLYEQPHS